jgi:Tfp pilus assembly protein PilO
LEKKESEEAHQEQFKLAFSSNQEKAKELQAILKQITGH